MTEALRLRDGQGAALAQEGRTINSSELGIKEREYLNAVLRDKHGFTNFDLKVEWHYFSRKKIT